MIKIYIYVRIEKANYCNFIYGGFVMKHIQTINRANLSATAKKGGCGKCQASCQSACKTSCTVGNQKCANEENK